MSKGKEYLGRGWSFPFQFDGSSGAVAYTEFEQNIRQSMSLILATRPGERQMLPEFGCRAHELMFAPNTPATASRIASHVQSALNRWEPRIEVNNVRAISEPSGSVRVVVDYVIKVTQARFTLSQSFASESLNAD
jgi:phage baseplate assembly protein W